MVNTIENLGSNIYMVLHGKIFETKQWVLTILRDTGKHR